jgi:hypothetical protein
VISRLAFRHDGQLVAGLFEDAMISMTYARNLVDGFGLNWARCGAPVEGFSHPLWLVVMIGANLLPLGALLALCVLASGPRRHVRSWSRGLAIAALMVGSYQVFRVAYFHEWLPNTYYLKIAGVPFEIRALRGLGVVGDSLRTLTVPLVLAAASLVVARRRPVASSTSRCPSCSLLPRRLLTPSSLGSRDD